MGRLRTRTGCTTCKQRRVKCDEKALVCGACERLHLPCSYDQRRAVARGAKLVGPLEVARLLQFMKADKLADGMRILSMLDRTRHFFTPMCNTWTRNLDSLWQMASSDGLVLSSLVACFSVVQGSRPQYGQLDRQVYGDALVRLRIRIATGQLAGVEELPVQMSVGFLGFLETAGPPGTNVPLQHYTALAKMLALKRPIEKHRLSSPERDLYVLHLESLAFQATMAVFAQSVETVYTCWQKSGVFRLLRLLNPEGPEQVSNSPLLSGQYTIYEVVLEITYLLRSSTRERIEPVKVDMLEVLIHDLRRSVTKAFGGLQTGCQSLHEHVFAGIYQSYVDALLVCVNVLRGLSQESREEIDLIASKSLHRFIESPVIEMCYCTIAWPLQVLACATRSEVEFQRTDVNMARVKSLLDIGHKERLEATLRLAADMRRKTTADDRCSPDETQIFPPGLALLTKRHGILS